MDESGFLLAPLVRTTQAPRGHTPQLEHHAYHDRASVAAAVCLSPQQRHLRLFWEVFPDTFIDAETYVSFLEDLLGTIAGPVILLQDQAPLHYGEAMEEFREDYPRLSLEEFPAYAPELNPVEFLWTHLKAQELANYAPENLEELVHTLCIKLGQAHGQARLRSFLRGSDLTW